MTVVSTLNSAGDLVTITIQGRFDFGSHREFRDAYESHGSEIKNYTIDMSDTAYLDSSALGMLLLLRDFAGGVDASISIIHCNGEVRKIFAISNFEQLFNIE